MIAIQKSYIVFFILFFLFLVGCQNPPKEQLEEKESIDHQNKEAVEQKLKLKSSLNSLLEQESLKLSVKQKGGGQYTATEEFTSLVLEILKRADKQENSYQMNDYDVVFFFTGFQPLLLNLEKKALQFKDEEIVYLINGWDERQWERYLLKEINGKVMYDSFEKDILKQTLIDVNDDNELEEAVLYYNGDIRLKVEKSDALVAYSTIGKLPFSSAIPSHHYNHDLLFNGSNQLFVGNIYSFTNRYGFTSDIHIFAYRNGELTKSWSTNELILPFIVEGLESNKLMIKDKELNIVKEIEVNENSINQLQNVKDLEGSRFYINHVTKYVLHDIDHDMKDEVIISTSINHKKSKFMDALFLIYEFNENGLTYKESYFGSEKESQKLQEIVFNKY